MPVGQCQAKGTHNLFFFNGLVDLPNFKGPRRNKGRSFRPLPDRLVKLLAEFFSGFSPRFPGGTYGFWTICPTQHISGLLYTFCYVERVVFHLPLFVGFVHQRIVRRGAGRNSWNGCTLGLKSYPFSLRPNLRLAGPGIHGQTGLDRSNTGFDTCVQYALPDQGPEGAGSWSRMAHHLGRARLTSTSPPHEPGMTPLGDETLPEGCHTETIVWAVLGHRLLALCSVPHEIPCSNSLLASFKREPVYRFFSHIWSTHITVIQHWHSFRSLIPHRHSQTHFQRRCLGHKSFSMHEDGESVPRFQPGIDPFIGHPSRNWKMPVYRAPCTCSPIHRDSTTSMNRGPSAKPPRSTLFGIAKRRTSSRYQSEGWPFSSFWLAVIG